MHFVRFFPLVTLLFLLGSCSNLNNGPDVSNIPVELNTFRFEKDFFSIDTNNLQQSLPELARKYPLFAPLFFHEILNIPPTWPADSLATNSKLFIRSHYHAYDTSLAVFKNFGPLQGEMKKALQHVKYYFPEYKLPTKLITYIGPLDGYGDIIADSAIIVGLQHHLGKNFTGYNAEWLQQVYPKYISEHFTPQSIIINAMKNVAGDIYPVTHPDKPLIVQMVENGKSLYMLSRFLPQAKEADLIGYTEKQMKECYDHEAVIWDLFIQNNYLQTIDVNTAKNYVSPGPKTPELGEAAPGNIGSFAGWQIVKKYMKDHPQTELKELLNMNAEEIYTKAKYKP